jgi:hypothetical protein
MLKSKTALLSLALLSSSVITAAAEAAPIVGSFSLGLSSGSYVGANGVPATAATATGLDFGMSSLQGGTGTGNGFGTNGSAVVFNATGSFSGLNGSFASIADVTLGSAGTANPYTANPFISLGNYTFAFSNGAYTRSPLGTSVTITGTGTFSDGIAADTNAGTFAVSTSSQSGQATDLNFTFTSNLAASTPTAAVPEPAAWAMMILGMGVIGFAMRRRVRASEIKFDSKIKRIAAGCDA